MNEYYSFKNIYKPTQRAKWVRRKNKTQNDLATHQSPPPLFHGAMISFYFFNNSDAGVYSKLNASDTPLKVMLPL